jgi:outer membrane protein TolC
LHSRPDVKAAAYEVEKSGYLLQSARAAFLPSFNMVAGLGFQAFQPQRLFLMPQSYVYNASGALLAPVINRRALKANYSQANATQIEALYQYQKSILNAYTEVANNLTNISTLENNLRLRRQRASSLQMATEAATELFQSSRATYLDLLVARQNQLEARWQYINNILELNIARLNLYKSLGGLAVE